MPLIELRSADSNLPIMRFPLHERRTAAAPHGNVCTQLLQPGHTGTGTCTRAVCILCMHGLSERVVPSGRDVRSTQQLVYFSRRRHA